MKIPTAVELAGAFAGLGCPTPTSLHIVVLRKTPGALDTFDDMLLLLDGYDVAFACRCTADPGKPALEHPKRRDGTAVIAAGQHLDSFAFGKHHGEYECLVPCKPIPVLRYTSVDDPTGDPSTSSTTQIHRANAGKESVVVSSWSEGCIVVANPVEFAKMMELCHAAKQAKFTLTLMPWQ